MPIEQDSSRASKRTSVRPEPETTDDREWQIEEERRYRNIRQQSAHSDSATARASGR